MKSEKKPKAWQRGYKAGLDPTKKQSDNPYRYRDIWEDITAFDRDRYYEWYMSKPVRDIMLENERHEDWRRGLTCARRHLSKIRKEQAQFAEQDAEYELYANLGEEFSASH